MLSDSNENKKNTNPQLLFSWKAPLRPFKKRSALILRFYLAVALLLSLIFLFFGDKILIIPVWAVMFLFYILTITPPPEIENKITVFGIETAGIAIHWEVLSHFYFGKRFGFDTLTIVSQPPFSSHIYLVLPDEKTKNKVKEILSEHLFYQEKPYKTLTEKIADWLSELLPDEEEITNSSGFSPLKIIEQKPQSTSPLPQKYDPSELNPHRL